jgi:hypothetical protein
MYSHYSKTILKQALVNENLQRFFLEQLMFVLILPLTKSKQEKLNSAISAPLR